MRIWPHYEKGITVIDELSLSEINSMIEALQAIKVKGLEIQENFKEAVENYKASGSTAVGPMGYYPSHEPQLARAEMQFYDHWTNSRTTLKLSTKSASDLNDLDMGLEDLNFSLDSLMKETPIEEMKDTYVVQAMKNGEWVVDREETNLVKAHLIISGREGFDDETTQYISFGSWYPCGGVFVTKAMNRYFVCENNIKGLSVKEVSVTFYDAFVEEFTEGDKK